MVGESLFRPRSSTDHNCWRQKPAAVHRKYEEQYWFRRRFHRRCQRESIAPHSLTHIVASSQSTSPPQIACFGLPSFGKPVAWVWKPRARPYKQFKFWVDSTTRRRLCGSVYSSQPSTMATWPKIFFCPRRPPAGNHASPQVTNFTLSCPKN